MWQIISMPTVGFMYTLCEKKTETIFPFKGVFINVQVHKRPSFILIISNNNYLTNWA